jgi:hypothetical protein
MIPNGVELFQLRQRRSPTGDTYFTGRLGNALVVVIRDDIERDLWKVIAGDPCQTRDDRPSPARAIAPPADDEGWYSDDSISDDVPDDAMASPSQLEDR